MKKKIKAVSELNIDINRYTPSQYNDFVEDFFSSNHRSYSIVTGRGTVKSTLGANLITWTTLYFGSVLVGRHYYKSVTETMYREIKRCIERQGLGAYFEFKRSPYHIKCKLNNNEIFFTGLDDKEKGKGLNAPMPGFALFVIDEAQETSDEVVRSFRQTLARGYTGNGWKYKTLYLANASRVKSHYANNFKTTKNHLHLTLSYLDLDEYVIKEWLGEGFIAEAEELKEKDDELYRFEYLADTNISAGLVFKSVKPIDETTPKPNGTMVYGLDFGISEDPTVVGQMVYNRTTSELWILDEWYKSDTDYQEIADGIKSKWGVSNLIFADCADTGGIRQLQIYGIKRVVGAKKHGVDFGIDYLRKIKHIYIDTKKAPNHFREFTEYKKITKKDGSVVYDTKNNHCIDEVRYGLHRWINGDMR